MLVILLCAMFINFGDKPRPKKIVSTTTGDRKVYVPNRGLLALQHDKDIKMNHCRHFSAKILLNSK